MSTSNIYDVEVLCAGRTFELHVNRGLRQATVSIDRAEHGKAEVEPSTGVVVLNEIARTALENEGIDPTAAASAAGDALWAEDEARTALKLAAELCAESRVAAWAHMNARTLQASDLAWNHPAPEGRRRHALLRDRLLDLNRFG